jgi:cytochrome b561
MTRNTLSKVRHLAVVVLLSNLVLIGLLGAVLSENALAALPVFAIVLPLLSAAALEAALSHGASDKKPATAPRAARVGLGRPLHHAV